MFNSPDDSFGRIKREGDSLSLADTSDALKVSDERNMIATMTMTMTMG